MVETVETNAWAGDKVPAIATKAGAILIVAGAIEIIRISVTIIFSAFSSQGIKGHDWKIWSFKRVTGSHSVFLFKTSVAEDCTLSFTGGYQAIIT